ncbi:cation transporter [Candidatus Gottesmanbacteria bacterium]|nr:cation transporter [Candidatus Gottesmanbacteria bacterium]
MIKKTYKVIGMDCTSCAMLIESDLEDAGVKASCNYARETLEVEFDEQKIVEDKIREIVKASGYNIAN